VYIIANIWMFAVFSCCRLPKMAHTFTGTSRFVNVCIISH